MKIVAVDHVFVFSRCSSFKFSTADISFPLRLKRNIYLISDLFFEAKLSREHFVIFKSFFISEANLNREWNIYLSSVFLESLEDLAIGN